jgi:hypothetical protein
MTPEDIDREAAEHSRLVERVRRALIERNLGQNASFTATHVYVLGVRIRLIAFGDDFDQAMAELLTMVDAKFDELRRRTASERSAPAQRSSPGRGRSSWPTIDLYHGPDGRAIWEKSG